MRTTQRFLAAAVAFVAAFSLQMIATPMAQASEIKLVVNDIAITSYDIQRRAAFLKLQQQKGGAAAAEEEMIKQALRLSEMKRLGIRVSDQQVDDSYANFARSNKMAVKQLDAIMAQTGVTKGHFKDFIRTQMGWGQAMQRKFRSGKMSEQDVVQRMLQKGGAKPSATEYMLQQVIFVVPAAERKSLLGKRKREAEALRQRYAGCAQAREFVKGLVDVTVRDLGRVLAPELPPEWADSIKNAQPGDATKVRETDRGVEFIGVCSAREVSDDRVAQMVLQGEAAKGGEADDVERKYTEELRAKARIVRR